MNITTLALIGWILAIEFALVACVLLALLLRQSAKHSKTTSGHSPTIAPLAGDSTLADKLDTLERQNTSLSEQLANIQSMVKNLPQYTKPLPKESNRPTSDAVEEPPPSSAPQPSVDDFEDDEPEDLIDLFDESPASSSKPQTRKR